MKILLGGVLLSAFLAGASPFSEGPSASLKSLVEAERAFAEMSETKGMRDAFLANLAEGSVVFQPGPMDGRTAYEKSPNVPGMLVWKPLYADVSDAGDMGYTTGPWVFSGGNTSEKVTGHYVTIWEKGERGWKVVIDGGVNHPPFPENGEDWSFPEPRGAAIESTVQDHKESLMEADRAFSKDAEEKGFREALLLRADPSIRVYRPGSFPIMGTEAVSEALSGEPDSWIWEPSGGGAAQSGDLGYTYGLSHAREGSRNPAPGASNSYLRIWRRDAKGVWKVVLDLVNPLPAAPAKTGD